MGGLQGAPDRDVRSRHAAPDHPSRDHRGASSGWGCHRTDPLRPGRQGPPPPGLTHEGLRSYRWGPFGEGTGAETLQNPAKGGISEQIVDRSPDSDAEPVHLLVDSTGLKLCGAGEWLIQKHGTRRRRSWRKMHIGMDADTGRIVASELTPHDGDDGAQVGPLLDQVTGPLASFTGDGAYDRTDVYGAVIERHPD